MSDRVLPTSLEHDQSHSPTSCPYTRCSSDHSPRFGLLIVKDYRVTSSLVPLQCKMLSPTISAHSRILPRCEGFMGIMHNDP
jgi:hypothetical protein